MYLHSLRLASSKRRVSRVTSFPTATATAPYANKPVFKNNAWNGTATASVKAKAISKTSVIAAATSSTGTQNNRNNSVTKKKKSNTKNNELRALAFRGLK